MPDFTVRSLAGIIGLFAAPLLTAQSAFEGIVTYEMTVGGQTIAMKHMVRGSQVRQEVQMPGVPGSMYILIDNEARMMRTVMEPTRMYVELDFDEAERMAGDMAGMNMKDATFERMGRRETIAGVPCEVYRFGGEQPTEVCVATGMGWFMWTGGGLGGRGPATPYFGALRAEFKDGLLPLRISNPGNGSGGVMMTATSIERKRLDPSLFEVPQGFRKMSGFGG